MQTDVLPTLFDDDATLIAAFCDHRDEAAFRGLFHRHTPALYPLAVRLLGRAGGEAEDAVQETWLRAAVGLRGFAGRSALRTWLKGILIRHCFELLRARRRCPSQLGAVEPVAPPIPPERLDLERAVARLPDGYRTVLVLHDLQGWTHQEIGALLEIEPGTSKSQLARARQSLRSMWGPREGGSHEG